MTKLHDKKTVSKMVFLFALTYMISYMTRINYSAVISAIESETQLSRTLLSMAVTGSFITYGAGQVISGLCGDKFSPKKLILLGLCVTVCMNFIIPLCSSPYQMTAVWCVNGFAQSFMWPPMVRLMTSLLSAEDYKEATVKVSWGSSGGTIAVYLIAPLIISFVGWRGVFYFSAVCGIIMAVYWSKFAIDVPVTSAENKRVISKEKKSFISPVIIGIMIAIVLQGMLRDGVTTWMPSYIAETYNFSSAVSILTGVVLPIFSILSFQIASRLYKNIFRNPLMCAGVIFMTGTISALVLFFSTGNSAFISVVFAALLTGCMHGVNLMLICMIPQFFEKNGNVSTVSGVLNSCTYIGSALSTYVIADLSVRMGWTFTLLSWVIIAALGTLICFICVKPWDKQN